MERARQLFMCARAIRCGSGGAIEDFSSVLSVAREEKNTRIHHAQYAGEKDAREMAAALRENEPRRLYSENGHITRRKVI